MQHKIKSFSGGNKNKDLFVNEITKGNMKQAVANSGTGGGVSGIVVSNSLNDCLNGIEGPRTDYSTVRGKKVLVSPNEEQFELLKKCLEERTQDSRGETIYEIGVGEGNYFRLKSLYYTCNLFGLFIILRWW